MREKAAIDQCQRAMKVFKFKKYKDGYENKKVLPRGIRWKLEPTSRVKGWEILQVVLPLPLRRIPPRAFRPAVLCPSDEPLLTRYATGTSAQASLEDAMLPTPPKCLGVYFVGFLCKNQV